MNSAGDKERLPGHPARIGRSKEHRRRSDLLGLADAAKGGYRFKELLEIAVDDSSRMCTFRLDGPRVDGVNADVARSQLFRQRFGHRINSSLRGTVNGSIRRGQRTRDGTYVYYAAAVRVEML